jgi:trimeric autotransporter adhesin
MPDRSIRSGKHTTSRRRAAWRPLRPLAPLVMLLLVPIAMPGLLADTDPQNPPTPTLQTGCSVSGTVAAGPAKLPGVVITVSSKAGATGVEPWTTSTGVDGKFSVTVPAAGPYAVKAELGGFGTVTKDVTLESPCQARVDIPMTLASRVAKPAAPAAPAAATQPAPAAPSAAPVAQVNPGARAGGPAAGQRQGQFQRVSGAGTNVQADLSTNADDARTLAEHLSLPPGFSTETLSETVTAFGRTGTTNESLLFGPGGDFGMRGGMPGMPGMPEGMPGAETAVAGGGNEFGGGGFGGRGGFGGEGGGRGGEGGGRGGGMGGPGGPGGMGGPPGGMRGGRGGGQLGDRLALANRMRQDLPHGNASYQLGGSPFDAAPYPLNGRTTTEPSYLQHRFSGSIGGQFKIPHLFDLGSRTSYFLSYSGNRSSNLASTYSTVPTAELRSGDFSSSSAALVDPVTHQAFPGNQIPSSRFSQSAVSLLQYIPLPNQPGSKQNYYYSTTNTTSSDDISFRFVRTFGTQRRGGRGAGGGGPMGGGPGGGGRGGGPGGGGTNLNVSVRWHTQESTQSAAFPTLSGHSKQTGWEIPVSFSFTALKLTHNLRAGYNINDSTTTNAFQYVTNVAGIAGITGVSADPFDWGVPGLSFSTFSGLRDISPSTRQTGTFTFSDSMMKMWKRHNFRWGFDYRNEHQDTRSNSNARGSYIFTGLYTGGGTANQNGADFADFLLGYAQQATIQYTPGMERYRSWSFNAYIQDDWRVRSNFTVNLGLRYEFQSPYSELNNQLVNLDVNGNFTSAVAVKAGEVGPYAGRYPSTIIRSDANNLSPRLGLAWRANPKTVVRGGYGINYSSVPYMSIVQKLAAQPPFAVTDTRIGAASLPLSLAAAFAGATQATTTNNYGVDPDYRIGYVHLWNVDVQRELSRTLSAGLAYTGTKGLSLDLLRAPNRSANGTTISGVAPFIWQSSDANSTMHSFSARLRKRLTGGINLGGTYTWSHSMDNASSLGGGGGGVVAQNDKDLLAEWSRSSFDVRHRFSGDFSLELPFGKGRKWLTHEGWTDYVVGGWMMNGTISVASGQPFTPLVTGAVSDVANGVNGTLRANYDGSAISLSDPTAVHFFNTAAFSVPATGTYGNAGRNIITGPGSFTFNMGLNKNFAVRGTRGVSLRIQANNVLNTPVWGSIGTTVNAATFGQVTSIRSMRSAQIVLRMNY